MIPKTETSGNWTSFFTGWMIIMSKQEPQSTQSIIVNGKNHPLALSLLHPFTDSWQKGHSATLCPLSNASAQRQHKLNNFQ